MGLAIGGQAEAQVLHDGEVEEQRPVLGDVCQATTRDGVRLVAVDLFAEDRDAALDGSQQARDRQQRGGLAGAVGAEQGHDLAGVDVQRQVAQHGDAAVAGVEAVEFDQSVCHHWSPVCPKLAPAWAWASPAVSPR